MSGFIITLEAIGLSSKTELSNQQKLAIKNYESHIKNKYGKATVKNHRDLITMFTRGVNKSFDQVTRQDIDNYLATLKPLTAEIMKSKIRIFYIWFYNTIQTEKRYDKKHLPDLVSDLSCIGI